jgi:hypothetical protein
MPLADTLIREPITFPESLPTTEADCKPQTLGQTLQYWEIFPFRADSVARYKRKKAFSSTPWKSHFLILLEKILPLMLLASASALTLIAAWWLLTLLGLPGKTLASSLFNYIGSLFVFLALCMGTYVHRMNNAKVPVAKWGSISLHSYTGRLPKRVKRSVARIRAVFPWATFRVEILTMEERVLDPLLWVGAPGESERCIMVWDEPGLG